jgi:hypothetical protein
VTARRRPPASGAQYHTPRQLCRALEPVSAATWHSRALGRPACCRRWNPCRVPEAVRRIFAAGRGGQTSASLVICTLTSHSRASDLHLTSTRYVSWCTSAHTYASPSDARLSCVVLGHLSCSSESCLRRSRPPRLSCLLALRYARDSFLCMRAASSHITSTHFIKKFLALCVCLDRSYNLRGRHQLHSIEKCTPGNY